jgi:hypothetical protein
MIDEAQNLVGDIALFIYFFV